MEKFVDGLVHALADLDPVWVYAVLVVSAFLENAVPPVPGDTVVVFSAYLVSRGSLQFWPVYVTNCFGGISGFMFMYYLGLTKGRKFLQGHFCRYFKEENVSKAQNWLARYGIWLVLANRFLSGIRSVIALSAGLAKMPGLRVLLFGSISVCLWNALLLWAGILVGKNWRLIIDYVESYNWGLLGIGGGLALVYGIRTWLHRRRTSHLDNL